MSYTILLFATRLNRAMTWARAAGLDARHCRYVLEERDVLGQRGANTAIVHAEPTQRSAALAPHLERLIADGATEFHFYGTAGLVAVELHAWIDLQTRTQRKRIMGVFADISDASPIRPAPLPAGEHVLAVLDLRGLEPKNVRLAIGSEFVVLQSTAPECVATRRSHAWIFGAHHYGQNQIATVRCKAAQVAIWRGAQLAKQADPLDAVKLALFTEPDGTELVRFMRSDEWKGVIVRCTITERELNRPVVRQESDGIQTWRAGAKRVALVDSWEPSRQLPGDIAARLASWAPALGLKRYRHAAHEAAEWLACHLAEQGDAASADAWFKQAQLWQGKGAP